MIKVLVNAYACSPGMGSEPGMGWNWCINLAKYVELHIITEGEFRDKIEEALLELPQGKNMHFYYNPVSKEVREMCWNQGDWRFYNHYKKWQYKTYELAQAIVESEKVDVLHQLNMIGFREPGYLWKIPYIPLVWGPIGGLKQFPVNYLKGAPLKMQVFQRIKNFLNIVQLKYDGRVNATLRRAALISSIPDSYKAIKKYKKLESVVIPETGSYPSGKINTERFDSAEFNVLWVGKFDFRKQLPLAIRIIKETQNKNVKLHVYGTGTDDQLADVMKLTDSLGVSNQIVWHGSQPNSVVQSAMKAAQLFLFTSVSEDTSTVALEAISNGLPILCFDACGFGAIVDNTIGKKVELSSPDISILSFAKNLNELEQNRNRLKSMSENCNIRRIELSWESKAKKVVDIYYETLNKKRNYSENKKKY